MTAKTEKTVSQAKPKAAAKKKPTAAEQAKAAVAKMRQASIDLAPPAPVAEIAMIPVNLIRCNAQVRTEFDDETIAELAADIAERGLIQPVLLRRGENAYLMVAGERRFRAAKLAGLELIPAILSDLDNETASAIQIAENIQREDLSLADTATAVRKLYELNNNSVTETAAKLHKSKGWVSKRLAASCPDLRYMAKEILEGGFTEDLEIILILDKLQTLDWSACRDLCQAIKDGKAGRQTVKDAYAAAKAEAEEREARRNQPEDEETDEEQEAREAREAKARKELAAMKERQRLDPIKIRWRYNQELEADEKEALAIHLAKIYADGEYTEVGKMVIAIVRMATGDYSNIELAAFIAGNQGTAFDLDELIKLTIEGEAEDE